MTRAGPFFVAMLLIPGVGACQPAAISSGTAGDTQTQTGSAAASSDDSPSTDSDEGTGSEGPDLCDPALYEACWTASADAMHSCFEDCGCGDLDCDESCHMILDTTFWDCAGEDIRDDCSGVQQQTWLGCKDACATQHVSCVEGDCDPNWCEHRRLVCANSICTDCPGLGTFEFAYLGACELVLPAEPPSGNLPYVEVVIAGEAQFPAFGVGADCQDPDGYAIVWVDEGHDSLLLCASACEAFAIAGMATVEYGAPPCE